MCNRYCIVPLFCHNAFLCEIQAATPLFFPYFSATERERKKERRAPVGVTMRASWRMWAVRLAVGFLVVSIISFLLNHLQQKNTIILSHQDSTSVNMTHVHTLVEAARRIQRQHGVVMFCMINDAYFDFAASWGCNTAPLGVHRHVLFLTTDLVTGQRLKSLWPNMSIVALDLPQFSGFRNYSKAGHVRMMTERTRFILHLLEAGVPMLLFEVDCLWLKDPLPFLLPPSHAAQADIVGTKVSVADKFVVAAGFLLLHPTPTTILFWRQLTNDMDQLVASFRTLGNSNAVDETKNEQEYFTNLAKRKFAGINIAYLSDKVFPDGKWYSLPEKVRQDSRPILINNNWVIGKDSKRGRAKNFGHWFWDEAQGKCNATAVQRLFHL